MIDKVLPKQPKEFDTGNREYKLYLSHGHIISQPVGNREGEHNHYLKSGNLTRRMRKAHYSSENDKYNRRASQLLNRLSMGGGRALYILGIDDDGNTGGIYFDVLVKSLVYLMKIACIANVEIRAIRIYNGQIENSYLATIRIRYPDYFETDPLSQLSNIII